MRSKLDIPFAAWTFVLTWMSVIFIFSSIPDLRSGLLPLWDLILRKIAHAAEYAVLAWLTFRAFEQSGIPRSQTIMLTIVFSVLYAGTDEFHQTFVPGREGSVWDVGIDSIGAVVGIAVKARR